jgi:hypothetical protein
MRLAASLASGCSENMTCLGDSPLVMFALSLLCNFDKSLSLSGLPLHKKTSNPCQSDFNST